MASRPRHAVPERTLAEEIEAGARWLEGFSPRTAKFLRRAAREQLVTPDDRLAYRRMILRRYARLKHSGRSRTAQARLIAAEMAMIGSAPPPEPGTADEQLRGLIDMGYLPLGYRTIIDDLDPSLD